MDYEDFMRELHQIITYDLDPNAGVTKASTATKLSQLYNALKYEPFLYEAGSFNPFPQDPVDLATAIYRANVSSLEG